MTIKTRLLLLLCTAFNTVSYGQLKVPVLSSSGETVQTVGLTEFRIAYSRPVVNDRDIFSEGGLVPYGKIWRAGANDATKITIDRPVKFKGQLVEEGSYAVLAKPGKENWQIYLYAYEDTDWNTYVELDPIVSIEVPSRKSTDRLENLTFHFQNVTFEEADIVLGWDDTRVHIPIEVATEEQVLADFDRVFGGPSLDDYFQAALYLQETNKELDRALEYIQNVTKVNDTIYFVSYRETLILQGLNRKAEALVAAKKTRKQAVEAKLPDFVELVDKLIVELSE